MCILSGRRASGSSLSLTLGLVVVALLAVVIGYAMGNYAIKMLTTPHQTTPKEGPPAVEQTPVSPATQPGEKEGGEVGKNPSPPAAEEQGSSLIVTMEDEEPAKKDSSAPAKPAGLFRVQVGAFAAKENAEKMAERLKTMGYPVWVTPSSPYRVQVGAFSTRERAEALKTELKGKGIEAVIVVQ